jgi:hypothetical protein
MGVIKVRSAVAGNSKGAGILATCQPCGFVFPTSRYPRTLPGKDAPAGFPESWGARAQDHTNKKAAQKAVSEFQLASRTYPADERERAFPPSA